VLTCTTNKGHDSHVDGSTRLKSQIITSTDTGATVQSGKGAGFCSNGIK